MKKKSHLPHNFYAANGSNLPFLHSRLHQAAGGIPPKPSIEYNNCSHPDTKRIA